MTTTGIRKPRVVCLSRDPFADKIPSLCAILSFLSEDGFDVELLAPLNDAYPAPSFLNDDLRFVPVGNESRQAAGGIHIPVSTRLLWSGLRSALRVRPCCFIGASPIGIACAAILSRLLRVPAIALCVELPLAALEPGNRRSSLTNLERWGLRASRIVVEHDEGRASFAAAALDIPMTRFLSLPNGTRGTAERRRSRLLHERLGLEPGTQLILHPGGIGPPFDSLALAKAARSWPSHWRLVFHTSFNVSRDPYYNSVKRLLEEEGALVSDTPVETRLLDDLFASADVCIALYSPAVLGVRAELMGLASGKIGNALKCGVPVVAGGAATLQPFLERFACGVYVREVSEIQTAIRTILADRDRYSSNAVRCFDELWAPDPRCRRIADVIRSWRTVPG